MKKIAIAGIGGVGGYFGGWLAKHYENSDVEIYFIARGENETAIRDHGLQLETTSGNFTAHPKKVSADPNEIGPVDLLLCCTKTYDLEESIARLRPCITRDTVILPLQNGVDSRERIHKIFPEQEV